MQLWKVSEQLKSVWKSLKTTPAVVALLTLFSQQPANAKWISLKEESYCEDYYVKKIFDSKSFSDSERLVTCEWGMAYTISIFKVTEDGKSYFTGWKSPKYDSTWKQQKCRCVKHKWLWFVPYYTIELWSDEWNNNTNKSKK